MKSKPSDSRLVYSTDTGRICPACSQPQAQCACKEARTPAPGDGKVRVSLDTKGRAGKGVTVVKGLPLAGPALLALGKQLRSACGAGGTVKDGALEIQGDHAERVLELLQAQGFSARRAGG